MSTEFEQFAQTLDEKNGIDQLKDFEAIAAYQAELVAHNGGNDADFSAKMIEAQLWALVKYLYDFRIGESEKIPSIHPFSSDALVHEAYLAANRPCRESWIIYLWLTEIITGSESTSTFASQDSVLDSGKWSAGGFNGQISGGFANGDQGNMRVYKQVYQLLRQRDNNGAQSICEKTGNFTLKMSVLADDLFSDPVLDQPELTFGAGDDGPSGVLEKVYFDNSVPQICVQLRDIYEKAIYAWVGGYLDPLMDVSNTWEEQFLSYMRCVVINNRDNALKSAGRPVAVNRVNDFSLNPSKVLEILSQSTNVSVREDSTSPYRIIMAAVIRGSESSLISNMEQTLVDLAEGRLANPIAASPEIIRVMCHLAIWLRNFTDVDLSRQAFSLLVTAYCEILTTSGFSQLCPIYIQNLNNEQQVEAYSRVLQTVTNEGERKQHILLSKKYDIDINNSVRACVEEVLAVTKDRYAFEDPMTWETSISDAFTIQAASWYVDISCWADGISAAVALYRRFSTTGRLGAILEVGKIINIHLMLKKYDGLVLSRHVAKKGLPEELERCSIDRREIDEYLKLSGCLQLFSQWKEHLSNNNGARQWYEESRDILTQIDDTVRSLATTWMLTIIRMPKVDEETKQITERIRMRIVPYLLLTELNILADAKLHNSDWLLLAKGIVNLVADEQHGLYKLLQSSNLLEEFVKLASAITAAAISKGERPFFDV